MHAGSYDAVVVGAGPNGLSAAIVLARAGRSVLLVEAADGVGGGTRSAALTLPGFVHDVCSAIHPTGVVSPFFRSLALERYGLEWAYPLTPVAQTLAGGGAAALERSIEATGESLGEDARAWHALMDPLVRHAEALYGEILRPLRPPLHPLVMARFGSLAWRSAASLARARFRGPAARALFAGLAAHSVLPLQQLFTASFGLVLGIAAHAVGWPCARGGSGRISDALAAHLRSLGGEIQTGRRIGSMAQLPPARVYLFDLTPRQLLRIAGERLPAGYCRRLEAFRYGPAVFKLDWALSAPIPWPAPACARAGTVHVGGSLEEIEAGEAAVWRGEHPEKPFVLVAQQSCFDPTRAPAGKHTGWAYCHTPHASTFDMTERIEAQIERFAPGFRDCILARSAMSPADFEHHNENCVGGDITGGVNDLRQLFTRPVARLVPYSTPNPSIYICSSSTPPGGGVHGLCGYFAANAALRRVFGEKAGA